ncbi:MAG: hypothetical protein HZA37_00045 [Parcubacteria group bacterium]|nr:hypothetical protein [Parcubacteria group bacterium]
MNDPISIFTESGTTHVLPLIILIVIIYALSNEAKNYDIAPAMGAIVKMTVGLLIVTFVHLFEFLTETHRLIPFFHADEDYVEIIEIALFSLSFLFFFWGLREVKKISRGS